MMTGTESLGMHANNTDTDDNYEEIAASAAVGVQKPSRLIFDTSKKLVRRPFKNDTSATTGTSLSTVIRDESRFLEELNSLNPVSVHQSFGKFDTTAEDDHSVLKNLSQSLLG